MDALRILVYCFVVYVKLELFKKFAILACGTVARSFHFLVHNIIRRIFPWSDFVNRLLLSGLKDSPV